MVGGSFINEGYLHIGCLLTGIHLTGSYQMVNEQLSFYIRCNDAQFIHPGFRNTLHITLIADPGSTPAGEVNTERKRSALLSVFQEFKLNSSILGFCVVHPNNESGKVSIFSGRVFLLKLQITLKSQYRARFEGPSQTVCTVFIMSVADAERGFRCA